MPVSRNALAWSARETVVAAMPGTFLARTIRYCPGAAIRSWRRLSGNREKRGTGARISATRLSRALVRQPDESRKGLGMREPIWGLLSRYEIFASKNLDETYGF